jgi:bifunctional non-homologous end joining protein LigD
VTLWSRNGLALDPKFQVLHLDLKDLKLRSTILDGEIVALDCEGIPRFQLLQKWQKQPIAPVAYYVFDLLWRNGSDWTAQPLINRREQLNKVLKSDGRIQIGGYVEEHGIELFRLAKESAQRDLESTFRQWHPSFRPAAASPPTS